MKKVTYGVSWALLIGVDLILEYLCNDTYWRWKMKTGSIRDELYYGRKQ